MRVDVSTLYEKGKPVSGIPGVSEGGLRVGYVGQALDGVDEEGKGGVLIWLPGVNLSWLTELKLTDEEEAR